MGKENVRITKPGKFGHIASLGRDAPTSAVLPSESASRLHRSYVGFFPSFFGSGFLSSFFLSSFFGSAFFSSFFASVFFSSFLASGFFSSFFASAFFSSLGFS